MWYKITQAMRKLTIDSLKNWVRYHKLQDRSEGRSMLSPTLKSHPYDACLGLGDGGGEEQQQ